MKAPIKTLLHLLISSAIVLSTSCGSDDSGPSYDFIDQNLQGTIDGLPFVYGEGTVEASSFEQGVLSFDLYHADEEFADVCNFFGFGDLVSVFFSVPDEVGIYELYINFDSGESQTVTLFNPDGSFNAIASQGAVEILTITDTQVTGRMDATLDAENTVNGNFTVVFCTE